MACASRPRGWDPSCYAKFRGPRLRPALELLSRVPVDEASLVYDLGCGTGEVTRVLARRFRGARVVGLDASRAMLERASAKPGRIEWVLGDIAEWTPATAPDLIYSNAALHWLDDHASLFLHLFGALAPGGCLAVQIPLSETQPSHRLMLQTLEDGGGDGRRLGDPSLAAAAARGWVLDPHAYHDLLGPLAADLDLWRTDYFHRLEGEDAVFEWVRSTALRPVFEGLREPELARFLELYRKRLRAAYPRRADGFTLYVFPRLFLVATRPNG